ncbi:MAG: hypothetical protein FOGNACKC_06343 [Anaerolineae bacterium]|nr:hypothetical protein [Anaerolineae bacterium]
MNNSLLLGVGRYLIPVPRLIWQRQITKSGQGARAGLAFMTADHHRVRDFAVRELPRLGKPLSPELIAESLALLHQQVTLILDELEQHMTFIFRNTQGLVVWAYPVTIDCTPHRVTFSTGEQVNAA